MENKENKYSYFVSYMYQEGGSYMPGNMEFELDGIIKSGAGVRYVEGQIKNALNGALHTKGISNRISLVIITNFILLSGGESPALPTDEEIRREAHKKANESPQDRIPNGRELAEWGMAGFVDGAKWMRDKISQEL